MVIDGAPTVGTDRYCTRGGIAIQRNVVEIPFQGAIEPIVDALDGRRGVLLASSYEYPGRYTRWDMGFIDPPLELVARGRAFRIAALNERGRLILPVVAEAVARVDAVGSCRSHADSVDGTIINPTVRLPEEERSRQPSIFSVLRAVIELFGSPADPHLGLYGAFGYDLAFQFESIHQRRERAADQRDLVLYLPDELILVDHRRERAERRRYDFEIGGNSTHDLPRDGAVRPFVGAVDGPAGSDHQPGEYADVVRQARAAFRRGDLFEAVPGQTLSEPCTTPPSELFRRLRARNPAPYGFLINLGGSEYLVGASPEMYVRVEGDRVETCPISGTIARGINAVADAHQIRELLNSAKDEAELTMCTDVDRNDKARICRPGSVRVIGRRQIELYSRLIHTVDHVEGRLRPEFDALDAFLSHAWAVTVTGAPKASAMQFIEDRERSPRAWYGGAVGKLGFDGTCNTGLTLRTVRVNHGVAEVRVGATLLHDSDPDEEERETRLKASAMLDAIRRPADAAIGAVPATSQPGVGTRILLIDHQDSFVHTLADYLRQAGAEVVTLRTGFPLDELDARHPDLVVLSPGPGRPADFAMSETLGACIARGLPVFGVCLGLQGLVEHFGGELGILGEPVHGKASRVRTCGEGIFDGLPRELTVGRYHSLFAVPEAFPSSLRITARSDDGVIMAVEHCTLPLAAVQFHPESILSLDGDVGLRLIRNVVARLRIARAPVPG